ncbi:MAG: cobalt-precorrin-6A reductase [Nostocaceae cyanobacterium]|nr:cobalt-precorrin-6A reductase [Nostocaceae cyanobacterium]
MKRVLILSGTGDASKLAAQLAQISGVEVITSLAGRTQNPVTPAGIVRVGGFSGAEGLAEYIRAEKIDVLIDATHPYAAQISLHAAAAANLCKIPHLMFVRPSWEPVCGDDWIDVNSVETAVDMLQNIAQRVFLTVGRQQLAAFAHLDNLWFLMRLIDPPSTDALVPPGKILYARGPFAVENEYQLLQEYQIDTLVSKNSGGDATYAKIIAARQLGVKVVMVKRPATPPGETVSDGSDALAWVMGNG